MKHTPFILTCIIILASASAIWANGWNVELVGREPFGAALDVHTVGDYAYLCAGGVLVALDVSNPSAPALAGRIDTPGTAYGVYVSGSHAYVAAHSAGLRVIDVSDPSSPNEVGFYDTPGYSYGVYVSGSHAYVADYSAGLRVVDVSDPANPHEVGFHDTPEDHARGAHVSGGYAYVADSHEGLRVR